MTGSKKLNPENAFLIGDFFYIRIPKKLFNHEKENYFAAVRGSVFRYCTVSDREHQFRGGFCNGFTHSVGEIYVIPTDPDQMSSGTMGMFYQSVLQVLGVSELEKDNVKVYPNPTADFIYVKLSSKSKIEGAEIYDLSGKLVLRTKLESEQLDLRSLPQGVYMVVFKNSDLKPIKIIKKP